MKKVLITGFDPFGGEKINPAYEAVKLLPDEISGAKIIKKEIPTVFQKGQRQFMKKFNLLNQIMYCVLVKQEEEVKSHQNGWVLTLEMQELPIMKAINQCKQVL